MSIKCSAEKCLAIPTTQLFCESQQIILCSTHFYAHNETCSLDHRTVSFLKNISDQKSSIESTLKSITKNLLQENKNLIIHFNELIEQLMQEKKQVLSAIYRTIQHCKILLKFVREKDRIPIIYAQDTIKNTQITIDDINIEMTACRSFNFDQIGYSKSLIKDVLKNNQSEEEIHEDLEDCLYFFIKNSKTLVKFDPSTLSLNKINTEVSENQGEFMALCSISYKKVFVTGGKRENFLDCCYIINAQTGKKKILPKIRKRAFAQALYYKNAVFIFGGFDKRILASSDMFNLTTLSWKSLSNLPTPLDSTSATILSENNILIVGSDQTFKHFCLSYNIVSNSYSNFSLQFSSKNYDLLIQDDDFLYLLNPENILITTKSNLNTWDQKPNSTYFECTTSRVAMRNKKAYFYDMRGYIYEFDLESLVIKKILNIN
ncbi:hypothetical protein SteCoe_37656 [Stentor coeruleus]|uniref:Kelch motif family protein n=1 Tax=Stentor coeruleus TaxID=5963 RepID=A0A1R2AMJ3_9CILI|nr:hypothetical protein SteCoe_37656 [Stentor coeruleus]